MKPISNWDDVVPTSNREALQPGGYVIKITKATDDPKKEYLKLVYDIAEGDQAKRYSDEWGLNPDNDYAHMFYRSYKEKALGMLKAFLIAVDKTNGTHFEEQAKKGLKEEQLVGKLVGIVLSEEEYENNRGEVKVRLAVASIHTADEIRKGEFKVPALKKLKGAAAPEVEGFTPLTDTEVPF